MVLHLATASRTRGAAQAPTSQDYWTDGAGELAAKIVARTAPQTTVALTVRNISSLGDDDVARIRRALRSELRRRRLRLTPDEHTGGEVQVTLSENIEGLVWVAEIRNGSSHEVAMVTVARPQTEAFHPATEPLTVKKSRLYGQAEAMLDVALLAISPGDALGLGVPRAVTARVLVLGRGVVSLYEKAAPLDKGQKADLDASAWQRKAAMPFLRLRPGPRDDRGRLVVRTDNQFVVYLPGEKCSGTLEPPGVDCHESDEPWPLDAARPAGSSGAAAYFTLDRNFFDGRVRLEDGREMKVPPFFAGAAVPVSHAGRKAGATSQVTSGAMWLLAGLDGHAQLLNGDGVSLASLSGMGSSLVGLQTGCRSGWQALATQASDFNEADAIQAYEIVNHKAVAASLPVEFAGPVMELWPSANGSEAIAISHNLKTAEYEAFRLSISCGQ